jgi:hypothetical protein
VTRYRMLYDQRTAVARMSPRRRRLHMLLWWLYSDRVSSYAWARRLWGRYRRTWPK